MSAETRPLSAESGSAFERLKRAHEAVPFEYETDQTYCPASDRATEDCDVCSVLATVQKHMNKRGEYITACQNSTGGDPDYYRWTGHAGARRQLAESLGSPIPGGWL